jgi:hypothetical protein
VEISAERIDIVYYTHMSKTHKIQLSTGRGADYAIVDIADSQLVNDHGKWFLHKTGYVFRNITVNKKQVTLYLHRLIAGLEYGDGLQADHIDGNKLNNSRSNLRVVTQSENNQNKNVSSGTSRFRGVSKAGNSWVASVNIPGDKRIRKCFRSEEKAALWAEAQRSKYQPFATPDPEVLKLNKKGGVKC